MKNVFLVSMKSSGLAAMALATALVTGACAGSSSPVSPSAASLSDSAAVTDAKGGAQPMQGSGGIQLTFFNQAGNYGFASVVQDGVPGRLVVLTGDIAGENFEPGVCNPGFDADFSYCLNFGDGPGQFTRQMAPGGTAFTTCKCTVGGRGNAGDQVILKISYPPTTPGIYPAGFTKFAFQDGTGELASLSGQGTLDFTKFGGNPGPISFTYRFAR
jgi:hypothetical protein